MAERPGVQALDLSLRLRADVVLELLGAVGGRRIADLGCGTGYFSGLLLARGFGVVGVDVSEANLRIARERHPGLDTRLADLGALPFESSSVEAAVCLEVLEHVEHDEAALREIRRMLRPGGQLVVSVPSAEAPPPLVERLGLSSVHDEEGPERHVREGYRSTQLMRQLEEAGFDVERTIFLGGPCYRVAVGVVSLVHLAYRRASGQRSWNWADVEADAESPLLRAYGAVFPAFLALARVGARRAAADGSTLILDARAR